ncbi:orotidine-5'-phosphate decarboxylase [Sphaerochaeta associata]|jgi:orotidine-5'-phosphate decarboxylase|uniref:Orotidine-5'-phosphate decarboxylase n=1 Tax=Sphaerochaeta associata TaxID=1129264 RepID=A0ABY4D6V2_9SPIR|nr:orotidine-5'-phosphate decarboxylase [Sphaerochaeta associata]NLA99013.1 orotidine-5'-phosphate decarboxylase [Spirochaetales bacterium]UOM50028.1 orotidine-5'-phosphate decarboxylase [Sphaerochaeta associata]SMP54251.1 orotidine-5'-phosphate decarboxylase [Sphaerochaeta associata]
MQYGALLEASAKQVGNIACMGLDPQRESLPLGSGDLRTDVNAFFQQLFRRMVLSGLIPAAFKPNIGYYQSLDKPREEDFSGSLALVDVLDLVENFFPGIPVILDSKRGDIARSSLNYAQEAFDAWACDAVTVAPYMGSDSVKPFTDFEDKGVYILNRTSNPGGRDLQNLLLSDQRPLYLEVASQIAAYNDRRGCVGAVVGATNLDELRSIAAFYQAQRVPMLIPGVGSQGGSATEVMEILRTTGYPLVLARINSSSALTHPWKQGPVPEDWLEICEANLRQLIMETAL